MSLSPAASALLPVVNPATLEVIGEVPRATGKEVAAAVHAAQRAARDWAGCAERSAALLAGAKDLKGSVVRLARLLTGEQGKPLRESMEELMGAAHWLRSVAGFELPPAQRIATAQGGEALVTRRPAGTVAAITPWNYPVILAMWKIAPALLAGNCVILKPSPFTPLTTIDLVALLNKHLPSGVLQVLTGDDETGRQLVAHPGVDHVSLTGSTAAGRSVGAQAGRDLKTTTLELGGNDAALVLADADPGKVADDLFKNAFKNCGQTCTAIKRVYAHRSVHDELAEALGALASSAVAGDGLQSATRLGPLNNEAQLKRVRELLADALARGGTVAGSSAPPDLPGYFHPATIVTGLPDESSLVAEEQFGPALPLLTFDVEDEAVARINRSEFGLGGSVWSSDPEHAASVAAGLACGTTWINQHSVTDPAVPFGGTKASGLGYANGEDGLAEFTRLRVSYSAPPVS